MVTSIGNCLTSFFPPSLVNSDFPRKVNGDFRPITEDKIFSVVRGLPINKAIGHDDIHAKVLEYNIDVLCTPLCHLFNRTSESHCYQNILKLVKVVLVLNQEVQMILVVTDRYPY